MKGWIRKNKTLNNESPEALYESKKDQEDKYEVLKHIRMSSPSQKGNVHKDKKKYDRKKEKKIKFDEVLDSLTKREPVLVSCSYGDDIWSCVEHYAFGHFEELADYEHFPERADKAIDETSKIQDIAQEITDEIAKITPSAISTFRTRLKNESWRY